MARLKPLLLACGLTFAVVSLNSGGVLAQSAEWNSLFERIVRLEHEVRAMKGSGGGVAGGDTGYRMSAIEEQLRRLAGQLDAIGRQMQQMQGQIEELRRQKSGRLTNPPSPSLQQNTQTAYQQPAPVPNDDLYSTNDELDLTVLPETSEPIENELIIERKVTQELQPDLAPKVLGQLVIKEDGTVETFNQGGSFSQQNDDGVSSSLLPGTVETASLGDVSGADGAAAPDALYKRSYDNLLKRRFGLAEAGFKTFLSQNNRHKLAGEAQYWLGETYYAQGRYKQAAQSFLTGYKGHPRDSKAAASLLKLGMSLGKLGQRKQACGAFAEVKRSYPKNTATTKLAVREMQRGGC
jgi:tol-pal system protein YbgF